MLARVKKYSSLARYLEFRAGLGRTRYKVHVIGDFSRMDAERFFRRLVSKRAGCLPPSSGQWERVYEVCGGNALKLIEAAGSSEIGGGELSN